MNFAEPVCQFALVWWFLRLRDLWVIIWLSASSGIQPLSCTLRLLTPPRLTNSASGFVLPPPPRPSPSPSLNLRHLIEMGPITVLENGNYWKWTNLAASFKSIISRIFVCLVECPRITLLRLNQLSHMMCIKWNGMTHWIFLDQTKLPLPPLT